MKTYCGLSLVCGMGRIGWSPKLMLHLIDLSLSHSPFFTLKKNYTGECFCTRILLTHQNKTKVPAILWRGLPNWAHSFTAINFYFWEAFFARVGHVKQVLVESGDCKLCPLHQINQICSPFYQFCYEWNKAFYWFCLMTILWAPNVPFGPHSERPHPFCFWVLYNQTNTWAFMLAFQAAQLVWILFYIYLHDEWQMYMNESPKQERCLSILAVTPSSIIYVRFGLQLCVWWGEPVGLEKIKASCVVL